MGQHWNDEQQTAHSLQHYQTAEPRNSVYPVAPVRHKDGRQSLQYSAGKKQPILKTKK
jgi:hypothetical protein